MSVIFEQAWCVDVWLGSSEPYWEKALELWTTDWKQVKFATENSVASPLGRDIDALAGFFGNAYWSRL